MKLRRRLAMTKQQKIELIEKHFHHPIDPKEMNEKELNAWVHFIAFLNK
jgi:hypothetical protein